MQSQQVNFEYLIYFMAFCDQNNIASIFILLSIIIEFFTIKSLLTFPSNRLQFPLSLLVPIY